MKQQTIKHVGLFWIAAIVGLLQSFAQPLSFETRLPAMEGYVQLRQVTETEDEGFVLMFTDQILKLNKKGERVWRRFSHSIPNPYKQNPNHNPHYSDFIYKRDTTYLRGVTQNSSYYAMLNSEGRVLFDTTYFLSWRYAEDPFTSLGSLHLEGDEFVSLATVFTNLRFDSVTFAQPYDNRCLLYQRVNKFTGARRDVKTICLSDTDQHIRASAKLQTSDRGYLLNVFLNDPSNINSNTHNLMVRLDSSGNLIEVNDMFPTSIFPQQGYQRFHEFEPIYDPEMYDEKYYPLKYTFDSAAIGVWVRATVGKEIGAMMKEYLLFYDTFGRLVNYRESGAIPYLLKSRFQERANSYRFLNEDGSVLWDKYYDRKNDSFYSTGTYRRTSYEGLFKVNYRTEDFSRRFYLVQHIGPHGYDFGYDPDAPISLPWNEQDSLHIWFNARGDLSAPLAMEGWEVKLLNSLGQDLYSGTLGENGELPLPSVLSAGIYLIQIRSPESGKVYYVKLFKE